MCPRIVVAVGGAVVTQAKWPVVTMTRAKCSIFAARSLVEEQHDEIIYANIYVTEESPRRSNHLKRRALSTRCIACLESSDRVLIL